MPSINAGGAVEEPFPSIWIFTFGYFALNPSAHNVIRLFSVSEPTLLTLPDTPLAGAYDGNAVSTLTACAEIQENAIRIKARVTKYFFIIISLRYSWIFSPSTRVFSVRSRSCKDINVMFQNCKFDGSRLRIQAFFGSEWRWHRLEMPVGPQIC